MRNLIRRRGGLRFRGGCKAQLNHSDPWVLGRRWVPPDDPHACFRRKELCLGYPLPSDCRRQNGNRLAAIVVQILWRCREVTFLVTEMHFSKVPGIFATSEFFRESHGVNPPPSPFTFLSLPPADSRRRCAGGSVGGKDYCCVPGFSRFVVHRAAYGCATRRVL